MSDDPEHGFDVLLFADDGYLSSIEIVYYGGAVPREFPTIAEMRPAWAS